MKAVLRFDLNDPDDKKSYNRVNKSMEMALVLWKIAYNLRKSIEHQIEVDKLTPHQVVDKIYEEFWNACSSGDINIDNLID
jgi:hypothetical protein